MKLRPYQTKAIEQLRTSFAKGNKRVILCAPTGAGKTVIFSQMVKLAFDKGNKVLIVTDRIELLTQSGGALNYHNIKPTEITAKSKKPDLSKQVHTAMVETLARRLKKANYKEWFNSLDLIIFDEAHKQPFNKLFPYINKNTFVIGATATPYRDGNQQSLDEFYTDLIEAVSISELIEQGFLAIPRYFIKEVDMSDVKVTAGDYNLASQAQMYEDNKIYIGAVKNYREICDGKKALVFCSTINNSLQVKKQFELYGYDVRHLDSTMSAIDRVEILEWYKTTKGAILCNVGILTTGFDAPTTEVVILYRATKSMPLFLQMVGRGARIAEGKKEFFVLDFGNNSIRFNFWHKDRTWSLEKKKKKEGEAVLKECGSCESYVPAGASICPECGAEFESVGKIKQLVELVEVKSEFKDKEKWQILKEAKAADFDKLVLMTKAKLIKPFWVLYNIFNSYNEALRYTRAMGYKDGFLWYQTTKLGKFKNLKK